MVKTKGWMGTGGWALMDGHLMVRPWKKDQMDTGFYLRCKDLVQITYKAGIHVQS